MPMSAAYRNAIRNFAGAGTGTGPLITHIGLLNSGTEITGGSPAYARKAVTWDVTDADGLMRPSANLVFDIPSGATVTEWRGYSALTAGTDMGGQTLTSEGPYAAQGTYTLLAASTSVDHNAA